MVSESYNLNGSNDSEDDHNYDDYVDDYDDDVDEAWWWWWSGLNLAILLSVHTGHAPHNLSVPDREWACPVFYIIFIFTLDSII